MDGLKSHYPGWTDAHFTVVFARLRNNFFSPKANIVASLFCRSTVLPVRVFAREGGLREEDEAEVEREAAWVG